MSYKFARFESDWLQHVIIAWVLYELLQKYFGLFFPDIADIPFSIKFPAFYRTKAFIQDFPGAHSASAESSIAAASPRLSADIDYPGSYSSDGTDRRPALRLLSFDVAGERVEAALRWWAWLRLCDVVMLSASLATAILLLTHEF